ncbi:unnamed protein product [Peniophora sp. CBMAI 1063]|nr:unnamed protein product [Peniophora sp. CBMAI 1063]
MSETSVSLPSSLATSLALEPVHSAFARRRAETRRWNPARTKEWQDELAQKVIHNKKARADCNTWLKHVSSPVPKKNKAPTASNPDDVLVYVNFLWLSTDTHLQHTKALEPIHLARQRWKCQPRNVYKTIHDVYPKEDQVPVIIAVETAPRGQHAETIHNKSLVRPVTRSSNAPSSGRRTAQKRKRRLKNQAKPDAMSGPTVASPSDATPNDTMTVALPRDAIISVKRRRTGGPDASTHNEAIAAAVDDSKPTSQANAIHSPAQMLPHGMDATGEKEPVPLSMAHVEPAPESPEEIDASYSQNATAFPVVPVGWLDDTTRAREPLPPGSPILQHESSRRASPGAIRSPQAPNSEPPTTALDRNLHSQPMWPPLYPLHPSLLQSFPGLPSIKAEPQESISLDDPSLRHFTPDPEVDIKPAVTPTMAPVEVPANALHQGAPLAQVPSSGHVPRRPALGEYKIIPPIWAQSRQEVCENADYFRAYQSGVYYNKDQVYGYLLGGFPSKRDAFEHGGRLIISHGGGGKPEASYNHRKRALHKHLETGDQHLEDNSVRALMNNWKNRYPVVLLADDHYALFPYNLAAEGYVYIVLGYYWVTNVWAECDGVRENGDKIIRYKVSFQWCSNQGVPWWIPADPAVDVPTASLDPTLAPTHPIDSVPIEDATENSPSSKDDPILRLSAQTHTSQRCAICAMDSVQVYNIGWICLNPGCRTFWTIDGNPCSLNSLTFDPSFTALQMQPVDVIIDWEWLLPPPPPTGGTTAVITSNRYSRGMHCRKCGRLSCRFRWSLYECGNATCKKTIQIKAGVRTPREFWTQTDIVEDADDVYDPKIVAQPEIVMQSKTGEIFMVTTYILPHGRGQIHRIRSAPRSNRKANEIFRAYQEQAASGQLDFRRFPLRAHQCRGTLLTGYFSQNSGAPYNYIGGSDYTLPLVVTGEYVPFNEIMSVAYMEDQRMAWHADAERGLGPVVASLSLGSTSHMYFRRSKHNITDDDVPKACPVLTLVLKHGDILVMQGSDIQDYYEHTVEPMGFRMVATARVISPDNYSMGIKIEH